MSKLSDIITNWLGELLVAQPPSIDIIAFNIGLFEIEDGYAAYVSGATKFDAASDDWAFDETYHPLVGELVLQRDEFTFLSWEEALTEVSTALKDALNRSELKDSPLVRARGVTVGFDDGDLVRVM